MKAVVAAFNQEKALVGAFSVITNLRIAFVWISSRYPVDIYTQFISDGWLVHCLVWTLQYLVAVSWRVVHTGAMVHWYFTPTVTKIHEHWTLLYLSIENILCCIENTILQMHWEDVFTGRSIDGTHLSCPCSGVPRLSCSVRAASFISQADNQFSL